MKYSAIIATLVASTILMAQEAPASDWQSVRVREGVSFIDLNLTSVRQLSSGTSFTAIWRTGQTRDKPAWIYSGTVNCELESVAVDKKVYVDGSGVPAVTDYVEGTYTKGTYQIRLPENEKQYANIFPVATSDAGLLVTTVCQGMNGLKLPGEEQLQKLKRSAGCTSGAQHFFCREEDVAAQAISRSLMSRAGQVEVVCNVEGEKLWKMIEWWLERATNACTPYKLGCGTDSLSIAVDGLGGDLARVANGDQSCSFTNSSLQSSQTNADKNDSIKVFNECAKEAIVKLDDRKTTAEVVAQAVYGKCQQHLHPDLLRSKPFKDVLDPKLTAMVLEYRAAEREKTNKQQKSPSNSSTSKINRT